jgi:hypothetical protein
MTFASPQSALREVARKLGQQAPLGRFLSASCPAHSDSKPSLSLWVDRTTGRLRAKCFAGCAETKVLAALGIGAASIESPEPTDAETLAEIAKAQDEAKKTGWAWRIWEALFPVVHDTSYVTYYYLTQTRGLALPPTGVPAVLRESGGIRHLSGAVLPAMVARVDAPDGSFAAIHRTWLDPSTGDKAKVEPNRAMLGPQLHGAIRLFDNRANNELLVAEGIETALAAGEINRWQRSVWAAVSTSGLMALSVPKKFGVVVIAADNDASGAGVQAANTLAHRLRKKGVHARVIKPPGVGTDWNDVLIAKKLGKAA